MDKLKGTKGLKKERRGPCGDFDEAEIKAFSLSTFAFSAF